MSQIQRTLTILTSLGPPAARANYSLQAMVPYDLLSQCSAALPRPSWEPLLYYSVVSLMVFIICCVLVLAYFESDRVMAEYIRRRWRVSSNNNGNTQQQQGQQQQQQQQATVMDKGKVFDLRSVSGLAGSSPSSSTPSSAGVKGGHAGGSSSSSYCNGKVPIMNGHSPVNHLNSYNAHKSTSAAQNNSNTTINNNVRKSTSRTFLGNLIKIIKSSPIVKYFYSYSHKKNNSPQQEKSIPKDAAAPPSNSIQYQAPSSNKPVSSNKHISSSVSSSNSTSGPYVETSVLSEKSIPNNNNPSKREKKTKLNHRKQIELDDTINTEPSSRKLKENKDPSPNISKKSSSAMLDDFDDLPLTKYSSTLDQIDDFDEIEKLEEKPAKQRSSSKRNKSKNKDKQLYRRESSFLDDIDDVSSTTTESSAGDVEDKTNHDTTIPDITTTKKKKSNSKNSERLMVHTHGGDVCEDDSNFEVTSKSKAHRKIRVNKETFGGDIMRPSTIELPYCLPTTKDRALMEAKRQKKAKKAAQKDLSELSNQTESFAQKHSRAGTHNGLSSSSPSPVSGGGGFGSAGLMGSAFGFSQDRLAAASRNSYSSIVSSSSNLSPGHTPSSPTTVNGLAPLSSSAVVGSHLEGKISPQAYSRSFAENGKKLSPSSWSLSPSTSGDAGFAMQHAEPGFSKPGMRPMDGYHAFGPGKNPFFPYSNPYPWVRKFGSEAQHPPTIMQQLQAERRMRLWEHQQKVKAGEEWPGFNTPLVRNDSLWDSDYSPISNSAWATPGQNSNGWLSTLTNSASSGWSQLQALANIWGGPQNPADQRGGVGSGPAFPGAPSTSAVGAPRAPEPPLNTGALGPGSFTPFTSMADIWSPVTSSPAPSASSSGSTRTLPPGVSPGSPGPIGSGWSSMGPPSPAAPGTPPVQKDPK